MNALSVERLRHDFGGLRAVDDVTLAVGIGERRVILGGAGTLLGPALGAAVIVLAENTISAQTERWVTVLGVIYVAVTLFAPGGLIGLARARQRAA